MDEAKEIAHRNILLIIAYDGTNYYGWQTQAKGITIQKTIEDCLTKILQEKVKLIGSGRTDRGVHALDQVANFATYSKIETSSIQKGLNSLLPKDIVVKEAREVDINFHARFHARQKSYIYQIWPLRQDAVAGEVYTIRWSAVYRIGQRSHAFYP